MDDIAWLRYGLASVLLMAAFCMPFVASKIANRVAFQLAARLVFMVRWVRAGGFGSYRLHALSGTGYRLLKPLKLWVECTPAEGYVFTVSSVDTLAYGIGSTLPEAIEEFETMLVDRFQELSRSESALGVALKSELASMRRYIAVKEPR